MFPAPGCAAAGWGCQGWYLHPQVLQPAQSVGAGWELHSETSFFVCLFVFFNWSTHCSRPDSEHINMTPIKGGGHLFGQMQGKD